jgi:hypothetical protein
MPGRRAWSFLGHALFFGACLVLATGIGMAAAIGCGYGGSDCSRKGVTLFALSFIGLAAVGYMVRFAIGYILGRIYRPGRQPKN